MFIQIHTDSQIESNGAREALIEERVRERLARFAERLTHVAIHVTDAHGQRGGPGLHATLEARINGLEPVAVTDDGATIDRVVLGAVGKAARALDHRLGRRAEKARPAAAG